MSLHSLTRRLAAVCETAAAAIFAAVCLLNFIQVVGRYAAGSSLNWAEEVMRYSMLWVMMLGGTAAIQRGDHMAVDTLLDALSPRGAHLLRSLLFGIAGIFAALLVWYGWPAALNNARQSAAASGLPMIVPYMALPVGGALMLVQIVLCWLTGFGETRHEEEAY
ncbi:TRAP transporter small permease [Salipiger marinus]|jgi:TRAP-type C4-dicarboxylate transport system permease small subunit|uniref:TRAP transporter small permease protein n=1 Tax=Salipiger marinus TaxID=555512 RepID=A0A1G8M798_9RHOB|nr:MULTISPECIES: TRAP transporter small permease [Salipiger]MEB3419083.1 TRAP transporter small permease [Salipiger manganoxidans]SDI63794.1 TRAP-type C4-dicarboxylate transport system, small permease component [Salipiger marinus]HBM58631.1 TRAP transporter small permease [Citreicella sp.]HBT02627.1 TRAP transporter small permease [Citreicella sp.]